MSFAVNKKNIKTISRKKVLVTGGIGFIGSNLVQKLESIGHHITIVDDMTGCRPDWNGIIVESERIKLMRNCFSSEEVMESIANDYYDCIFHLAALPSVAYSIDNPEHAFDVNVRRTIKLIDACSKAKVSKFVFSSSSAVYGNPSKGYYNHAGISENDETNPNSPYAWHKLSIEHYLGMKGRLEGLNSTSLRYFNVFGPGQFGGSPYSNAVSAWCHNVKNGLPLRSDGDGKQSRDMCYVDNIVSANILAMESKNTGAYNVGTGLEYSNESIINYFKNNFPSIKINNAPERPGDVRRTKSDISKISKELNYKPVIGFWEGLSETWKWWGLK